MKNEIVITVRDKQGKHHVLYCPIGIGFTLKDICIAYELPMEGICGTEENEKCETCHCYVLGSTCGLREKDEKETALLSRLYSTKDNSRLACQIYLTEEMNGLFIEIA